MNLTVTLGDVQKAIKWPDTHAKPAVAVTSGGQKPKK